MSAQCDQLCEDSAPRIEPSSEGPSRWTCFAEADEKTLLEGEGNLDLTWRLGRFAGEFLGLGQLCQQGPKYRLEVDPDSGLASVQALAARATYSLDLQLEIQVSSFSLLELVAACFG